MHWEPYRPSARAPWNLHRVVHLHRRGGFSAPWPVIQRDLEDGPRASIDRLLAGRIGNDTVQETGPADFESMSMIISVAAAASEHPGRLKAWWLFRMMMTPDPLAERIALMWHNHFATSNRKVKNLRLMRSQNELFRSHGQARFGELLQAVVKHGAMLKWLDADSNRKGRPNENLARELMELFTVGEGNFSESDVKEAARALTGWRYADGEVKLRQPHHDAGEKTVLGQTGNLGNDELLAILIAHPKTADRIAWRICHTFLNPQVATTEARRELAWGLRERDLDIGWAIRTVLRSAMFFQADNLGSRVASPVDFVVGTLRALQLQQQPPQTLVLAEWTSRMGFDLFYPPNVGGWTAGRSWLGTQAMVARANFAAELVRGELWRPGLRPDFVSLVRQGSAHDVRSAVVWLTGLLWGQPSAEAADEVVAQVGGDRALDNEPLARAVALLLARPESQVK